MSKHTAMDISLCIGFAIIWGSVCDSYKLPFEMMLLGCFIGYLLIRVINPFPEDDGDDL